MIIGRYLIFYYNLCLIANDYSCSAHIFFTLIRPLIYAEYCSIIQIISDSYYFFFLLLGILKVLKLENKLIYIVK